MRHLTLGIMALIASVQIGQAASSSDPDWPCIQRRQPQLSLAQVWSGPQPNETVEALAKSPEVARLAGMIALRRVSMEEVEAGVKGFAGTADAEALTALFVATFEVIQASRNQVMAGITRYAHKQEALDRHIVEKRHEFQSLSAAEAPDFDALDKIEEDIDWSTRIFLDRQQALTYVCETPVILEQRAFAIGRLIAGALPKE